MLVLQHRNNMHQGLNLALQLANPLVHGGNLNAHVVSLSLYRALHGITDVTLRVLAANLISLHDALHNRLHNHLIHRVTHVHVALLVCVVLNSTLLSTLVKRVDVKKVLVNRVALVFLIHLNISLKSNRLCGLREFKVIQIFHIVNIDADAGITACLSNIPPASLTVCQRE